MSIGPRIKHLRKEKKMSQTQLAQHLGVDGSQISKYENGENTPPLDKIEKIAEALGVSVSEITDPESLTKPDASNMDWIHEKARLLGQIEMLNEKLLQYVEGQLKQSDAATNEIIRLNGELQRLRDKYGE
jgi:transcriptional regulator with XRE-family HTH domain